MHTRKLHRKPFKRFIAISVVFLSLILFSFLILNLNIIMQSTTHPDQLPSAFGIKALIMLPESRNGVRSVGIIRKVDLKDIQLQDMVAYRQNDSVYIERVAQIKNEQGQLSIMTSMGAGETTLLTNVPGSNVEGILIFRIPRFGSWALFMQTPLGLLFFMVLPLLIFLFIDALLKQSQSEKSVS
jgi:signal peptidase